MTCFVSHTSVDCENAYALAEFWRPILGYVAHPEWPYERGDEECSIVDPDTGHEILFIEVPDPTPGKNKIHFDLRPRDCTRDEGVERLLGLGVEMRADMRNDDGTGWVIFVDLEGNEFCVLRSPGEL